MDYVIPQLHPIEPVKFKALTSVFATNCNLAVGNFNIHVLLQHKNKHLQERACIQEFICLCVDEVITNRRSGQGWNTEDSAGRKKGHCLQYSANTNACTHTPLRLSWPLLLLYVWHAALKLRLRGVYQGNSLHLRAAPSFFAHLPPA